MNFATRRGPRQERRVFVKVDVFVVLYLWHQIRKFKADIFVLYL